MAYRDLSRSILSSRVILLWKNDSVLPLTLDLLGTVFHLQKPLLSSRVVGESISAKMADPTTAPMDECPLFDGDVTKCVSRPLDQIMLA